MAAQPLNHQPNLIIKEDIQVNNKKIVRKIVKAVTSKPLVDHFTYQNYSVNPTDCHSKQELLSEFKRYLAKRNYKFIQKDAWHWLIYDRNRYMWKKTKGQTVVNRNPFKVCYFTDDGSGSATVGRILDLISEIYPNYALGYVLIKLKAIGGMSGLTQLLAFRDIFHLPNAFKNATLIKYKFVNWAEKAVKE